MKMESMDRYAHHRTLYSRLPAVSLYQDSHSDYWETVSGYLSLELHDTTTILECTNKGGSLDQDLRVRSCRKALSRTDK